MTRAEPTQTARSTLPAAHVGHSWLAAVLPADVDAVSVADRALAETLRFARAQLVDTGADVEIADSAAIAGAAPLVIVPIEATVEDSRFLGRRPRRVAAYAEVRARASMIRRKLRRLGYSEVVFAPWDLEQPIQVSSGRGRSPGFGAERFPRRAVIVARRVPRAETILERALREASEMAGVALGRTVSILRAGTLVTIGDRAVLRLAVGPGERQIDAQDTALAELAAAETPVVVSTTPELLASGRSGLARWSLEERVQGRPSPHDLADAVLADCLDFLVALHRFRTDRRPDVLASQAALVGEVLSSRDAAVVLERANEADAALAKLGTGFGHGDFCTSNLLVQNDRLSGVVDWDAGGHGHLPMLDLFHLRLLAVTRAAPYQWGAAVNSYLLPLAASGGDAVVHRYCDMLELALSRHELLQLAFAYWLQRVAYQLGMYVERREDRIWVDRNVKRVLGGFMGEHGG